MQNALYSMAFHGVLSSFLGCWRYDYYDIIIRN